MDLTSFARASVAGVPIVLPVVGLVFWCKKFKKPDGSQRFTGNLLLLIGMGWGVLLGGGYMVTQERPPAQDWYVIFVYWFSVLIYGVAIGLIGSGIYDQAKLLLEKTFGQLIAKFLEASNAR